MKHLGWLVLASLALASNALLSGCESSHRPHRPRSDYDHTGHHRPGWNYDRPGWGQDRRESRGGFQSGWYSPAHL